jgi:hypothetical protein
MSRLLEQSDKAAEVARMAFDAGDVVTGIAAIQLAAQLVQLARLFTQTDPSPLRPLVLVSSSAAD